MGEQEPCTRRAKRRARVMAGVRRQTSFDLVVDRRTKATLNREKALHLREAWEVDASQVRYSDDGHWYATLARFPAALFDAHGYVRFATEND